MKKNIFSILLIISLVLSRASCSPKQENEPSESSPVKVIIDCDMGYMHDDALALSMILQAEKTGLVDILGITLCGGNTAIDAVYENYGDFVYGSAKYVSDFLESAGRQDIKYYRGTDFPIGIDKGKLQELADFYKKLNYIKGSDTFGLIHFFDIINPDEFCESDDATNFLLKSVKENPGEVVILAIGPTTNIAKAVQKDADFASNVKSIYYMGGALGDTVTVEDASGELIEAIDGANVTPTTEYNVLYDPIAFSICISAPFKDQYVLPGSLNIPVDQDVADKIIKSSGCNKLVKLWAEHYSNYLPEYPYWDPLTSYSFLCPDAIQKSENKYVTVNIDRNSDNFGRTDCFTDTEYKKLTNEEKSLCGKATIIYETTGFWDYTIDLLIK